MEKQRNTKIKKKKERKKREEEERKKREEEIKKREEEERKNYKMCHMALATTLKNLENNTENPQIRKIIECYNPYSRQEPDLMKAQILSCCDEWENKENILKETIKYVWPEIDMDLDNYRDAGKLRDTINDYGNFYATTM